MTDQNSTTPQPDEQPPVAQPTQQLPVAGPAPAQNADAESPSPAQSPAPVPAPQQHSAPAEGTPAQGAPVQNVQSAAPAQHPAPAPSVAPAQHLAPAQNAAPAISPASAYVNPYSAPATVAVAEAPSAKNRTWVPVVSAAAAAALLASLGTAGAIALTDNPNNAASLADVGQSTSQNVPVASSTVENPNWTAVTSAVQESVVAIQVESQAGGAEGSGVVLDSDGRVLTNNHVVADATTVQVTLSDGRVYDADIVGTDPTTDLAVVQISDPPSDLKPATFADSSDVVVGEPVMALGNPLGLANTATTGIVSALDRPVTASAEDGSEQVVTNAIQIDAAVNPGNSGGPLFNASGEVIGITSSIATLSSGGTASSSSGSIGLGFAIPSNLATQIGDQLKKDGTAEHAFLGVSLSDATATADGVTRRGAGVSEVVADSPAGDAGVQEGDVVVAIDGDPVNGAASLTAFVREKEAGDKSVLTVVRDGKTQEITVTLAVKDETATQDSGSQGQQLPGQEDGSDSGSGSDQSQPNNIPDWLQDFFNNQG
ncbi:putative serine protease PepD [Promicromonospora sp. AC04]|uniref:S1C family serine protease n=1 Tax=Promicromonospora sp. AC04 TaxID=2135723 RepID=UPI000D398C57|nr:trypsin-like peptidase domain-containing protein [Promicromonospora sp. AC04]PUB30188.1 putative serine protease PepD [Promicromonospora sp. AC04]